MADFSLVDIGLKWFEGAVNAIISWFNNGLRSGYQEMSESLLKTPTPETNGSFVFGTPSNEPWMTLHQTLVGGEVMFLAIFLLLIYVQARHTVRIFQIGSGYEDRKARKTAWTGAFLIVTWYWVAVLVLYLMDGFTIALIPDFSVIANSMSSFMDVVIINSGLALLLAFFGGVAMWVLQALFFIRDILLYVYLYGMPLGVAVAYGNVPVVSQIARSICLKFVPLAVMPLPVAILFKGYELLFAEGTNAPLAPESAFLSYLIAISLPILAVMVTWKLFKYATPLTARVLSTTAGAAVTAGAVVGAGYVAGPFVASTAARFGPKAAAGHALAQRVAGGTQSAGDSTNGNGTTQDNVVTDAYGQQGVPSYRRTENDPGYQ